MFKTSSGFPHHPRAAAWLGALAAAAAGAWTLSAPAANERASRPADAPPAPLTDRDDTIADNARRMLTEGRETFRFDTFGSEAFWGDRLRLHQALVRREKGGLGDGVTARQALGLGLKVDVEKLPNAVSEAIRSGKADLDSSDTTYAFAPGRCGGRRQGDL
jgi:hypothetical protein